MLGCMKAEYFRLAKDVTAIYALFWEGMHEKRTDMAVIGRTTRNRLATASNNFLNVESW